MGVKHLMLPNVQPPTVAFAVLAQLCGPKANGTEMGAALFTKNGDRRYFDLTLIDFTVHRIVATCGGVVLK